MTVCTIPVVKELYKREVARIDKLMDTMQVTREGEVLAESKAHAQHVIDLLDKKDFDGLQAADRKGLVNSAASILVRKELKDVFKGAIAVGVDSTTDRSDLVLKQASYANNELTLVVTPKGSNKAMSYTFQQGNYQQNPSKSGDGTSLFIPDFPQVFRSVESALTSFNNKVDVVAEAKARKASVALMYKDIFEEQDLSAALGSAANNKAFDYKSAKLRQDYVHGDKNHMKSLLAELYVLGNNTIPEELFEYYNEVLDSTHPHFFRDMNVYINENAKHQAGWVELDKGHILLNTSKTPKDNMSSAEVYMHEMIHTMTVWGMRQESYKASSLNRKLNTLFKTAKDHITWKDIQRVEPNFTEAQAKERYNYIFESQNQNEEFVAFGITNPGFRSLLKNIKVKEEKAEGFLNKLKSFINDFFNVVMGNYSFNTSNSVHNDLHALAFRFAEINQQTINDIHSTGIFAPAVDFIDRLEGRFEEWADRAVQFLDHTGKAAIPDNMNLAQRVLLVAKFFLKGIYNKNYRTEVGHFMSFYGVKPTNSIREIIRSIFPDNAEDMTPQFLGLATNNIDTARNLQSTVAAVDIMKGFKNKISEAEEIAITHFLEANASTLFNLDKHDGKGYSEKEVYAILTDIAHRKRAIALVEGKIRRHNSKRANVIIGLQKSLGRFMATGKGHEALSTNSKSIVKGYGTDTVYAIDNKLLSLVETLTQLSALDHTNAVQLHLMGMALKQNSAGFRNVTNLYEAFKKQQEQQLFDKDQVHMVEGYTKELFDSSIDIVYEPLANAAELEKQGYRLVSKIEASQLGGSRPLGMFISDTYGRAERLRGSVSLSHPNSRGLSIRDIRYKQFGDSKQHAQAYFEADRITLTKKAKDIIARLERGETFDKIEDGAVPIRDTQGKPINYRMLMDKTLKAKLLKQDQRVTTVLQKTVSTVLEKVARDKHNDKILDYIKKDVKEVYDKPNNNEEYTLISPKSTDVELRDLFYMLPKSFQDFAKSRADGSLPIPSILMHQYFGYRHYRFTDTIGVKKLPEAVKHVLNVFETYFMDAVKILKGNVLLKMPVVITFNIIGNMLQALNTGMPVSELVTGYVESFRSVKAFMKLRKEVVAKEIELSTLTQGYMSKEFTPQELDEYNQQVATLKSRIARLNKEMKDSPVNELFDMGLYQSVIEDIEMYKLGGTNTVSDGMDKLLAKIPAVIKTPLQILYLSKETAWYRVNQELLQLQDLVARDVMNRRQKRIEELQADGKKDLPLEYRKLVGNMDTRRKLGAQEKVKFMEIAKASRHTQLLNSFINYTLPNGRGEEYLNRLGLLMFTKYLKRIQRVATGVGIKHPIRTAVIMALTGFLIDVDTIQDQSLLVRAFDNNHQGLFGVVPVYNPVTAIFDSVVNPPLVKLLPSF